MAEEHRSLVCFIKLVRLTLLCERDFSLYRHHRRLSVCHTQTRTFDEHFNWIYRQCDDDDDDDDNGKLSTSNDNTQIVSSIGVSFFISPVYLSLSLDLQQPKRCILLLPLLRLVCWFHFDFSLAITKWFLLCSALLSFSRSLCLFSIGAAMLCIRIMKYLPWWFTDIASNGEKKTKYSWKCSLCKISECFATFVPLNVFGYEYMYIYWETKKESLHDQPTTKITHTQTMYHSLYVFFSNWNS